MIAVVPAEPRCWEVCRVYVHPDQHGSGQAEALLQTAERHAMTSGAAVLTLWTDTLFLRAHRFYEKHGYVRTGPPRATLPGIDEFNYRKTVVENARPASDRNIWR